MEDKHATIKDEVIPDLLVSPHIVDELFYVVMGELQIDSTQQEQIVEHLSACEYCRKALLVLLSADSENDMSNNYTDPSVHNLLTQFATINHEIAAHDFEQMGAYAEAIKAEGRKKADKRFSVLAGHIRKCASCRSWLQETLDFLNESEEKD
jgi:hypothetical protein